MRKLQEHVATRKHPAKPSDYAGGSHHHSVAVWVRYWQKHDICYPTVQGKESERKPTTRYGVH